jgi:MFS family permease
VPKISTQFNAIKDVGWYGSAYLLTVTAMQPSFGKFFKFFNPKWVYLVSILIFEVMYMVTSHSALYAATDVS